MKNDKDYQEMFEMLISAVKIIKPSLTDKQASNVIINLANWKRLADLKQKLKGEV